MLLKEGPFGYIEDLQHPLWKKKRAEILQRDNNRCVNCGSDENLNIHHCQYHYDSFLCHKKRAWEYDNKYLISLCKKCHEEGHRLYKVPIKFF